MKKNKYLISICIVAVLLLAAYGVVQADQKYRIFSEPENEIEAEIKKEIDHEILQRRDDIAIEASGKFGISLAEFKRYEDQELLNLLNNMDSLSRLYQEVVKNQQVGDTKPLLYLHDNKGYIIEKKSDRTTSIYSLYNEAGTWSLVSKDEK